ncbi:MAG: 30S ribosomal protein S12 methylthiotransferase RimO [Bacilli bacterium]
MIKILIVSLGCVKNVVDSESVISFLTRNEFEVTNNINECDAIIINTCGFIDDAKKESINTIIDSLKYKKKLIVIGCLVERYAKELKEEIPEVDLFIPISEYKHMDALIKGLFNVEVNEPYNPYYRVLSTPSYTAYLKISDGCSNCCAYCAIPIIRGPFASVPKELLLKEVDRLISLNVKELVIISQDTTKYGSDIYSDYNITSLLQDILSKNHFISIRLLYLYSYEINDDLLDLFAANQSILLPYFDIPIQHSSNKMLKAMNRKDKTEDIISLVTRIRSRIPNAVLRTTIIVGFPGEQEEDMEDLLSFIKDIEFDHLGVFKYSREEGTPSYLFSSQIEENIKEIRYKQVLSAEQPIAYKKNKSHLNEVLSGIVTDILKDNRYKIRTYLNAPDDIDGDVYLTVTDDIKLSLGDVVKAVVKEVYIYDIETVYLNKIDK